uniref:BTB domain-containing protein n=1 Tax=Tetranychus urticae TaxID=32264 RepID=T1KGS8_TETUR
MFITNMNIEASLLRSLQYSFNNQTNCEITLMCEGNTIKCHRHVLDLHSSHFKDLFKDQTNFQTIITIFKMKYTHLKAIVEFMYFEKLGIKENPEEMQKIINCAGDLGLTALNSKSIFEKSVRFIKSCNKFHGAATFKARVMQKLKDATNQFDQLAAKNDNESISTTANLIMIHDPHQLLHQPSSHLTSNVIKWNHLYQLFQPAAPSITVEKIFDKRIRKGEVEYYLKCNLNYYDLIQQLIQLFDERHSTG